jgi:ABC-type antimicrobial peptide transport system permease subunit
MEAMGLAGLGVLAGLVVGMGMGGAVVGQTSWGTAVVVDSRLVVLTATSSLGASGIACLVPALMAGGVEPAAALRD